MTAATTSASATGRGTLAGTGTLVRLMLRRDRIKLPAWILGISVFWLYYTRLVPQAYPTPEDLESIVSMMTAGSGSMWTGPTYFLENMTYETFIPGAYGGYQFLIIALMMIADPVFGTAGSLLFAAGCLVTGLAFAGLASVFVQITEYSRTATSLAAGAGLGGAFMIRAIGDLGGDHGTALSWFSPLAWPQQAAPFVLDRWWPLALSVGFAAVTAALGYALSSRRDVGAGLVAARAGRARATRWLGTPIGLAWRLERKAIMWWAIGMGLLGMGMGAFSNAAVPGEMPEALVQVLGGTENILAGYLSYLGVFMATIVAVYAVLSVQGLRAEETVGRGEPVLATAVSRWSWLGSNLTVGAIGSTIIMVVAGAATGLGAASAMGDNSLVWEVTLAHLNHVPAVLVVLGFAGLLFGLVPKATSAAWALVGYGFLVGTFGGLMSLPDAAIKASPFEHAARMPIESFEWAPVAAVGAVALALAVAGLVGFRRRGINVT